MTSAGPGPAAIDDDVTRRGDVGRGTSSRGSWFMSVAERRSCRSSRRTRPRRTRSTRDVIHDREGVRPRCRSRCRKTSRLRGPSPRRARRAGGTADSRQTGQSCSFERCRTRVAEVANRARGRGERRRRSGGRRAYPVEAEHPRARRGIRVAQAGRLNVRPGFASRSLSVSGGAAPAQSPRARRAAAFNSLDSR